MFLFLIHQNCTKTLCIKYTYLSVQLTDGQLWNLHPLPPVGGNPTFMSAGVMTLLLRNHGRENGRKHRQNTHIGKVLYTWRVSHH